MVGSNNTLRCTQRFRPTRGLLLLAGAILLFFLLLAAAAAPRARAISAEEELFRVNSDAPSSGGLESFGPVATDPSTGHIFFSQSVFFEGPFSNNRINEFTPFGTFVKAIGANAAPGAVNEQQEVRVRATSGSFRLRFGSGGQGIGETGDLPFDATATKVEMELNSLTNVAASGGQVSVAEVAGSSDGVTPSIYVIAFKGALAGQDVTQVQAENGSTPLVGGTPATELTVRTRNDGSPAGGESETCTTESGCQGARSGAAAGEFEGQPYLAIGPQGDIYAREGQLRAGIDSSVEPPREFSEQYNRVQKFSPSGQFELTFGPGVLDGGAAGTGNVTAGSTAVTNLTTTSRTFVVGQAVSGAGIPAATTIAAVGVNGLTLSRPATSSGTAVAITVPTPPANAPQNERQIITPTGAPGTPAVATADFSTPEPSPTNQALGGFLLASTTTGSTTLTSVKNTVAAATVTAGSNLLENIRNVEEKFTVGEEVFGAGIPAGAVITEVHPEGGQALTISANATQSGTRVGLASAPNSTADVKAGSNILTNLSAQQAFVVGQEVSGAGIPTGTTVIEQFGNAVRLSRNASASGTDVSVTLEPSVGVGQGITGPGIPADAKVTAVAPNGNLTISAAATATATAASLATGIPVDASASEVQAEFEQLPNVGTGNVAVTGPVGGPWVVEFLGTRFADTNVAPLEVGSRDPLELGAAATFETETEGAGAAEVCTAEELAEGYLCDGGVKGTTPGGFDYNGSVQVGPDGTVYLAVGEGIAEFSPQGEPIGEIEVSGGEVQTLSLRPGGGFFAGGDGKTVRILSEAGTIEETCKLDRPNLLASDPSGAFYVSVGENSLHVGERIEGISNTCAQLAELAEEEVLPGPNLDHFTLRGITISGAGDLAVTDSEGNLRTSRLRVFGPAPVQFEAPPRVAPTIVSQFAESVGANDANVSALINPHFRTDAKYYVEYGTGECSAGGCSQKKPLPPGSLVTNKPTSSPVKVAGVALGGLNPGTVYHYRFVAESSGGGPVAGIGEGTGLNGAESTFTTSAATSGPGETCSNASFRTGYSAPLPDCRAFEMVSPIDKEGGDIKTLLNAHSFSNAVDQSATAGGRFTYSSYRAFGNSEGSAISSQYLAKREASGWQSQAILPRQGINGAEQFGVNANFDNQFRAFSADLCAAWLTTATEPPLAPGTTNGRPALYRRDNCNSPGAYETVAQDPKVPGASETELQGMSADSSAVVVRTNADLVTQSSSGEVSKVFYVEGGTPHAICVLPDGAPFAGACSAGSTANFFGASSEGDVNRVASVKNALSADGSKVYWSAVRAGAPRGEGAIFLRENPGAEQSESGACNEAGRACTVKVSESKSPLAARFVVASEDGSGAIYEFTEGALSGYLYQFDAETDTSRLIAKKSLGVAAASENLARVYFVSEEKLAGTAGATEGKPNLYLEQEEGKFTFIAQLSAADVSTVEVGPQSIVSDVSPVPVYHAAQASPDGSRLVFISNESITGYDNTDAASPLPCGVKAGSKEGVCDSEVYSYEVGAEGPVCISCNPTGAQPSGREVSPVGQSGFRQPLAATLPTPATQLYTPQAVNADGSYVFFDSYDALVPRDTNGEEDVYEWEAAADAASCTQKGAELYVASAGGCLSLISSGESPSDSEFLDASASGNDVFIDTNASLVPQDPGLFDVYDARVDGGFAPPAPSAGCEGEACQGPLAPPNDPTPSSATYNGPGNVRQSKTTKKHKHSSKHKKHKHKKKHKKKNSKAHSKGRTGR